MRLTPMRRSRSDTSSTLPTINLEDLFTYILEEKLPGRIASPTCELEVSRAILKDGGTID